MSASVYIEGGGDSKDLKVRCRRGFRRLFEKCGFEGRMPRLIACGSRDATFGDFKTAHQNNHGGAYVAILIDSEEIVTNIKQPWAHLQARDGWERPTGTDDDQALLMTTCMETWIVSDRPALQKHYGAELRENTLPPLKDMENRRRNDVQSALLNATRSCKNAYRKGGRSYEVLAELRPDELRKYLPSFVRIERVLNDKM